MRTYRFGVCLAALCFFHLTGCTATDATTPYAAGGGNVIAVTEEVGKTTSESIGNAGGTAASAGSGAAVAVPGGALKSAVTITVSALDAASFPQPDALLSHVYDIGPDGTQFNTKAEIAITMLQDVPANTRPVVAYLNAQNSWQVLPGSTVNPNSRAVHAQIGHFTHFAVLAVPIDGSGCAQSPDPNALCSPLSCDTNANICLSLTPKTYSVGGTVTGLGQGRITLSLSGRANVTRVGDGNFVFPTLLTNGTNYNVTLPQQPNNFLCSVANGNGTIASAAVTGVNVICRPLVALGGTVAGLETGGVLMLQNGNQMVTVRASKAAFSFGRVLSGNDYSVIIVSAPLDQNCTLAGTGAGTAAITDIALTVTCRSTRFTLGGSVTGLIGRSLLTLANGADTVSASNGNYTFSAYVDEGSAYDVRITPPAGQTCIFSGTTPGSGTMPSAPISTINVACAPIAYTISGTVAGLSGNANVTLKNANETLVTGNGAYAFANPVAYAANANLSVSAPAGQSCVFVNNSNAFAVTMGAANISNLTVACTANTYTLGGSVSGLRGSGRVTVRNGNDTLSAANGVYTLPTKVAFGGNYNATLASPAGQSCVFSGVANAVMGPANVIDVNITCTPLAYTLGGTVSGLVNNANVALASGNDTLSLANGTYTFPTSVAYNASYAVSLSAPAFQTCVFSPTNSNVGVMGAANITIINVACSAPTYALGGRVTGLVTNTNVVLANGNDTVSATNGNYVFPTLLMGGSDFNVSLVSPAGQSCGFGGNVTNAGTMPGAALKTVNVDCTPQSYSLSGSVSGLSTGANVSLKNANETLSVYNGNYTFATAVSYAGNYNVTLQAPAGTNCNFTGNHNGVAGAANVTVANIACGLSSYTLGGYVSGLATNNNVQLSANGNTISVRNGSYTFPGAVVYNSNYSVAMVSPNNQTCAFSPANANVGVMGAAKVTDVNVTCGTATYALGGRVTGLLANTNVTLTNGNDTVTPANGTYVFATPVPAASNYNITIAAPAGQRCVFSPTTAGVGTMPSAAANANVVCALGAYTVGGAVSGLSGTVRLSNNGNAVAVTTNGNYTIPGQVAYQAGYNVAIAAQPNNQICAVTGASGAMGAGNVTTVAVACTPTYALSGSVANLLAGGNVVVRNGNDAITVLAASPNFTFPTRVITGGTYNVTVTRQPVGETCSVPAGSGTMPSQDTTLALQCNLTLSFTTGQAAVRVIGQSDFVSNANTADATHLFGSIGEVYAAPNGALYIGDQYHYRVVGYTGGVPATNGKAFDFVVGQGNLTAHSGWTTPNPNVAVPYAVTGNQNTLVAVDGFDNRVLIFSALPRSTTHANVVLGQSSFTDNAAACTQSGMNGPRGAALTADGHLLVADAVNNRVLVWAGTPGANGQGADLVLGQTDFTTCTQPGSGASTAATLSQPWDVWSDGTRVMVADTFASRVLIWNTFPTVSGQNADAVLGQSDFASNTAGPGAISVGGPSGVTSDGNSIFVSEYTFSRVTQWSGVPWAGRAPTLSAVLGAPDAATAACNRNANAPTAASACMPAGITLSGTQILVADFGNNRILVYQSN